MLCGMRNNTMDIILKLSTRESLALDRILQFIKEGIERKRKSVRISLTNAYFVESLISISTKKFMNEEEILALSEELRKQL
jgi:hypothetical protein